MKIHKRIKELRISLNMTQTELAEKLNFSQDTISLWERGKSFPDVKSLIELTKIFNVSSDYILGLED